MTNDRFYRCQFPVKAFQLTPRVYAHAELWPDWLRTNFGEGCLITRDSDGDVLLSTGHGLREITVGDWIIDPGGYRPFQITEDADFRAKFSPASAYVEWVILREGEPPADLEQKYRKARQEFRKAEQDSVDTQNRLDEAYENLVRARQAIEAYTEQKS